MSLSILFMMKHAGTARNFEAALGELAQRGHELRLAVELDAPGAAESVLRDLRREHGSISIELAPKPSGDRWSTLKRSERLTLDYLRYLEPRYERATKLRERARDAAPPAAVRLAEGPVLRHRRARGAAARALRAAELSLPPGTAPYRYLHERRPDVVLVSPLVGLGSRQADYVRAARWLGIPSGLLVHSWDNLTNKGLIRDIPQLVAVWNAAQAQEARELHQVPAERIAVTGATAYDHWFTWTPSRDREAFCAAVGLRADRPLLLYTCSSPFIAPDEVGFVRRWLQALRGAADPELAGAGVIVRPHPQNAAQWHGVDLGDAQARVWPAGGADPSTREARSDLFDSIHHARAVVGINTSALIESAIAGRPVFTILDEDFRATQAGTLHFDHLAGNAGVLTVAGSLDEHVAQLAAGADTRRVAFLESFVRPYGLDQPAAPRLADAIEALARQTVATDPLPRRLGALALRTAQLPLARAADRRRRAVARQARHVPAPGKPDAVADARAAVAALATGDGEVVLAGPWTSEVGYELLYWRPFLTWALETYPTLKDRTVVISRGGTASWYEHLGVRYVDLFDQLTPDELHRRSEEIALVERSGSRKQMDETPLDRELLELVGGALGLTRPEVLHPGLMYRAYRAHAKRHTLVAEDGPELFTYRRLAAPPLGSLEGLLPEEFVAVRFYFRASLPEDEQNRRFIAGVLRELSARIPVVLLNPAMRIDDHWDYEAEASDRVIRIDEHMTPATNLAVQTAVLARAKAFTGTYGGFAYLAPLLGVPSWTFFSEKRFRDHHGELAAAVFAGEQFGAFRLDPTAGVRPAAVAAALAAGGVEHASLTTARG